MEKKYKIVILGAGRFGIALGNVLATRRKTDVCLMSIDPHITKDIHENNSCDKYYPNFMLNRDLRISMDLEELRDAAIVFIAIPSGNVIPYLLEIKSYIDPTAIIVNTAKGFSRDKTIISQELEELFPNEIVVMKGPSFAIELIRYYPTAFTVASKNPDIFTIFKEIFKDTTVYLDFTDDVIGVELLSIFKNIYSIALGIIDAQANSMNLRFMVLNKEFKEVRKLVALYGGDTETIFNYCGFGDFTLSALTDLSRNRTMGLLIGKNFINENSAEYITLEGKRSLNICYDYIQKDLNMIHDFPVLNELWEVFNKEYNIRRFTNNILNI